MIDGAELAAAAGTTSQTIEDWRNLALIFVAIIGLPLAIWRSWLVHRQMRLSEAGQNLDRYQKGAAMLGDERQSVRQAGIYSLVELVKENPRRYYVVVIELLCAFIRDRSAEQREEAARIRADAELSEEQRSEKEDLALTVKEDCQTALTSLGNINRNLDILKPRSRLSKIFKKTQDEIPERYKVDLNLNLLHTPACQIEGRKPEPCKSGWH